MAKQPKTPAAKHAAKKAAKKIAKPTAAAKPVAKKPAGKKSAAKKPATAKKPTAAKQPAVAKKSVGKKSAAKKPATAKTAKKVAKQPTPGGKKVATKRPANAPISLLTAPATPTIDSPANGATVPANMDLAVKITTNQTDLNYVITVTDNSVTPPAVTTLPANAPGTSPFTVMVPGNALPPGRTITIKVTTNPVGNNSSDTITITTPVSAPDNPGGGGGNE